LGRNPNDARKQPLQDIRCAEIKGEPPPRFIIPSRTQHHMARPPTSIGESAVL